MRQLSAGTLVRPVPISRANFPIHIAHREARHLSFYGVAGLGAGGMLNFESSTGAFSFISVNVRVEVGFPSSSVAARAVNGNFSPSASR